MTFPADDLPHIDGGLSGSTSTWSPDEFVDFGSDLADNFIPSPDLGLAGLHPSVGDSSSGSYEFLPDLASAKDNEMASSLTSGSDTELVRICQLLEDTLAGIVQSTYPDKGINGCKYQCAIRGETALSIIAFD